MHAGLGVLWTAGADTSSTWLTGLQGGLRYVAVPGATLDLTPFAERAVRFTQSGGASAEADLWVVGLGIGMSMWFR